MALPAPPPAPIQVLEADDLPYVPSGTARGGGFLANPRALEQAARVGLVLALVVALAGVVGAISKSGDDDGTRVASRGDSKVVDDPLAEDDDDDDAIDPVLVPEGFELVQGDGVYLALPVGWRSLSPEAMGDIFDEDAIEEIYPDLEPRFRDQMQTMMASGALLMSIDPDPGNGGANVNILQVPGRFPLDELVDQVEGQLRSAGLNADIHDSREIETPLGTVMRVSYSLEVSDLTIDAVQYWVPSGPFTYIVSGTGSVDVLDAAIQTFRVGDAPTPA